MTQTENYKKLKKLFLVSVINYFKISCSSQSSCYPNLQGLFTSSPMIISHLLLLLIEIDIHLDPMYEKGTSWSSLQYWPKFLSSLESVISQIFVDHLPRTSYLPGDSKVRVPCTHEADILAREMETRNKGNGQFAIKAWRMWGRCSNREKNEWRMSSQAQMQSDGSFRKATAQGGYCLQHLVFYISPAALKKHRASSFNKQHPGLCHQQQLPWVDTALDQCSISPPICSRLFYLWQIQSPHWL